MSVTSGFFNSLKGDRRYDAKQISSIFDGIITDGVFANIGTAFGVKADIGNTITVGIGRSWFNSTWTYNDAILPIDAEKSDILLDRYDAVVIEIDHRESVRKGDIKIIKGTPSSSPQHPEMLRTKDVNQYPLAYIYRKAESSSILQADITNAIGTSVCPYVTGILQVTNIDNIVAQWEGQWNRWFADQTSAGTDQISTWLDRKQLEFITWFGNLQTILEGNVATKLAADILDLQNRFNVLAKEYCIYQSINDSEGANVEDSYGTSIDSKIVYSIK